MSHGPPAWWVALQSEWSSALAKPLAFEHGTFESPDAGRVASTLELVGDVDAQTRRFALYHVQIWQRICATVQEGLPCTTRVLEPLLVNRIVLMVFADGPPDHRSLDSVSDRIGAVVRKSVAAQTGEASTSVRQVREMLDSQNVRLSVLQQALQVDLAHRIAFQAPTPRADKLASCGSGIPADAQASVNPTLSVLRLTHDVHTKGAPELPGTLHLAVVRSVDGVRTDILDPVFARLLTLSRTQTIGQARDNIANSVDASLLERLDSTLDGAIDLAFERNYWLGIR